MVEIILFLILPIQFLKEFNAIKSFVIMELMMNHLCCLIIIVFALKKNIVMNMECSYWLRFLCLFEYEFKIKTF